MHIRNKNRFEQTVSGSLAGVILAGCILQQLLVRVSNQQSLYALVTTARFFSAPHCLESDPAPFSEHRRFLSYYILSRFPVFYIRPIKSSVADSHLCFILMIIFSWLRALRLFFHFGLLQKHDHSVTGLAQKPCALPNRNSAWRRLSGRRSLRPTTASLPMSTTPTIIHLLIAIRTNK